MRSALERVRSLYRVFGPFLRPYSRQVWGAWAALLMSIVVGLARPWPLKLMLDSVVLGKQRITDTVPFLPTAVDALDKHLLLTLLALSMVAIVLIESTFGYFQKVWFSSAGHSATTDVMEHVFTHMQMLPKTSGGDTRTGDVIVRITSDIRTLRDLLVNHVQKLGTWALTFFGTLAVMLAMNWQLTLLGFLVVPFIFVASYLFSRNIRAATKRKRKQEGAVASIVQETLTSMTVIQAFAQEEAERARFRTEAQGSLDASIESAKLGGAFTRTIRVLNTIGAALVLWLGASRVLDGHMSPGDLVVFAAYIAELYTPIQNISELAVQFMESLVSGERVLDLLHTMPRIRDAKGAVPAPRFRGEVAFENVHFAYPNGPEVLKGISFRVAPGETVALVGGSGAGKSTVLNLALRFFDPGSGHVSIDGTDIRKYRLQSLRRQVAVVLQEPVLFRRTVRENIAYGTPHATHEQIEAAARAAHAPPLRSARARAQHAVHPRSRRLPPAFRIPRLPMVLPIRVYGDPVLRQPTVPVTEVTDGLRTLVADMIETMHGADGVGLAAPQVGRSERVFVADLTPYADRATDEMVPTGPMAFLNPELLWESDEETDFEEGCLSIPDVRENVWRPERVRLRYRDLDFREHEVDLDGMLARVVQHEYDHLEGVLFLDHVSAFRRRMLQRRLRAMTRGEVSADYPIQVGP